MNTKESLGAVTGAIRASVVPATASPSDSAAATTARRIVTISRQAGIDAGAVARPLAATLSRAAGGGEPWQSFDRELIDRVASEHQLPAEVVSSRDEHDDSILEFAIHGLTTSAATGEAIPLKIAETVRHLAERGRAIIVGRGGQSILAEHDGAVHVRLVAPEPWRVERHAATAKVDEATALKMVRQMDANRARYIRSHYNCDSADPQLYHVVLNMARLTNEQAAAAIAALVEQA
ncbi:MAG: cytidylate kinase-like family protein [Planctomycetota bacterium]|jgi:cytidylate kinase